MRSSRLKNEKGAALLAALVFTAVVIGLSLLMVRSTATNSIDLGNRYSTVDDYWQAQQVVSAFESSIRSDLVMAYYHEAKQARELEKTLREKWEDEHAGDEKIEDLRWLEIFDSVDKADSRPLMTFYPNETWIEPTVDANNNHTLTLLIDKINQVDQREVHNREFPEYTSLLGRLDNWLKNHQVLVSAYTKKRGLKPEVGQIAVMREAYRLYSDKKRSSLAYPKTKSVIEYVLDTTSNVEGEHGRIRQQGKITLGPVNLIDDQCRPQITNASLKSNSGPEVKIDNLPAVRSGNKFTADWETLNADYMNLTGFGLEARAPICGEEGCPEDDEESEEEVKTQKGSLDVTAPDVAGQQSFQFMATSDDCGYSRPVARKLYVCPKFDGFTNRGGESGIWILENKNDGLLFTFGDAKYENGNLSINIYLACSYTVTEFKACTVNNSVKGTVVVRGRHFHTGQVVDLGSFTLGAGDSSDRTPLQYNFVYNKNRYTGTVPASIKYRWDIGEIPVSINQVVIYPTLQVSSINVNIPSKGKYNEPIDFDTRDRPKVIKPIINSFK
jgi:hypothetical protein